MPNKNKNCDQIQGFVDKARELGCDENEAAFEDRLREIANQPPQPANKDNTKTPE